MATTTKSNLIVPQVWADAVGPTILGRSVFAQLATVDDDLAGEPGDTVTFPKFNYIGDADDLTENVAMTPTTLTMTDSKATIKEAGKALELTDAATLSALGSPDNEARRQLTISVARKIDRDLRAAAEITENYTDSFGQAKTAAPLNVGNAGLRMSWGRIAQAIALLGDDYDPTDMAGLLVHSAQYAQLMVDPTFTDVSKFGDQATIRTGQVGRIGNLAVFMSDRATAVADVDPVAAGNQPGYNALLIRKGALALKYKRRPIVETDRDILKRTNLITTNVHYGTKRVDDRGIVVIPTLAAVPVPTV